MTCTRVELHIHDSLVSTAAFEVVTPPMAQLGRLRHTELRDFLQQTFSCVYRMHVPPLGTHHTDTPTSASSSRKPHRRLIVPAPYLGPFLLCPLWCPGTNMQALTLYTFNHMRTYKLSLLAPKSVLSTILSTNLDELNESSENPYQVGTVIVIIPIFIRTRKLSHKGPSHFPGVTYPVDGTDGSGTRQAGHVASAQTDRQTAPHAKAPSPTTHIHTSAETQKIAWDKHTATSPELLRQVGTSLLPSWSDPVPEFPSAGFQQQWWGWGGREPEMVPINALGRDLTLG